jgi:hypothetical protein
MSSGCLETAHPELEQSDNLGILPSQEEIGHNMEFASVMEATLGAEPPYTNFTAKFKGTLDYVWFTPGRLRVLAVTNVPDPQDLFVQCGEGLPRYAPRPLLVLLLLLLPVASALHCPCPTVFAAGHGHVASQRELPLGPHHAVHRHRLLHRGRRDRHGDAPPDPPPPPPHGRRGGQKQARRRPARVAVTAQHRPLPTHTTHVAARDTWMLWAMAKGQNLSVLYSYMDKKQRSRTGGMAAEVDIRIDY